MSLNEQIAVLDGLAALDPNDGRIGQNRAAANQYAKLVAPGVLSRKNVLDFSAGANFSGGSSYPDGRGIPLLPSSVGLAGFGSMPGSLPPRLNVIDASGGANYSGGSSYARGLPLLPSNAGLAAHEYGRAGLGAGEYGRAGLGGEYGRAGLGRLAGGLADADLMTKAETVSRQQMIDESDGRIGQYRAQPTQYANQIAQGVLSRRDVIDPSAGANYGGGSSYAERMPLLPSSAGLAGLDAVADNKLGIQGALKQKIGANVVANLKKKLLSVERLWNAASPAQKDQLFTQYRGAVNELLGRLTAVRAMRLKALAVKRAGGTPGRIAKAA